MRKKGNSEEKPKCFKYSLNIYKILFLIPISRDYPQHKHTVLCIVIHNLGNNYLAFYICNKCKVILVIFLSYMQRAFLPIGL